MKAFTAHTSRILAVLFLFSTFRILSAQNLGILPTPVARLPQRNVEQHGTDFNKRVDIQTRLSTCGFQDGDPNKIRTANPGFDCRVDTMNGLWGFCPVTVIAATDCGLAGSCVDQASCSSGCGQTDINQLTTFTCGSKQFCSTALLTFGVDQTYTYIACGGSPKTDHYLASPTSQPSSTTTRTKQTSTASVPSSLKSTSASPGTTSEPSRPSTTAALAKETNGSSGSNDSGGSSTNNTGAIIGGVIGGIALLCFSGIAAILLLRRSQSRPRQTLMNGAQRESHQAWYHLSPKTKTDHRFTGGWGPRELPSTSYNRISVHPVELPG